MIADNQQDSDKEKRKHIDLTQFVKPTGRTAEEIDAYIRPDPWEEYYRELEEWKKRNQKEGDANAET